MSPSQLSLTLCLTLCSAEAASQGPAEVTSIVADEGVYDWAMQQSTGRLFASSPAQKAIVECDPATGKEVRRWTAPDKPQEMIIKRNWLVVSCDDARSLRTIDLAVNEIEGPIPLGRGRSGPLFCSQADNAYVYALRNRDFAVAGTETEIVQVDLGAESVRRRVSVPELSPDTTWASMSADGKRLALRLGSDVELLATEEDACGYRWHRSVNTGTEGQLAAVPGNRYWTVSTGLWDLELGKPIRSFIGKANVHPRLDLVASLGAGPGLRLSLQKFTDPKPLKTVLLEPPASPAAGPTSPRQTSPPPAPSHGARIQFDGAGRYVVYAKGRQAYIVHLDRLGMTWQPLLLIGGVLDCSVKAGEELRLTPPLSNPELLAQARFELVSAPRGARWEAGQLVWRPAPTDVDVYWLELRAACGGLQDSYRFQVQVEPPTLPLGFVSRGLEIDPAGKYAVCWGTTSGEAVDPSRPSTAPAEWILADLDAQKILHSEQVAGGINFLRIDDKYIYLSPAEGSTLSRLRRDDVSRRERLPLSGRALEVITLGTNLLVSSLRAGWDPPQAFDRDTLQSVDYHLVKREAGPPPLVVLDVGQGKLEVGEQIINRSTGQHVCFVEVLNLPRLAGSFFRGRSQMTVGGDVKWGRIIWSDSLRSAVTPAQIARWEGFGKEKELAAVVSSDQPIRVALRNETQKDTFGTFLEVRELKAGTVLQSRLILRRPKGFSPVFLRMAGNRAVACGDRKLVTIVLADELLATAPVPLYLQLPTVPEGDVTQPLTFRVTAVGGEGERTFHLEPPHEGLRIDKQTGDVTIDLPLLWQQYLAALRADSARAYTAMSESDAEHRRYYRVLTGRPLPEDRIAVQVLLTLTVADSEGQADRLGLAIVATAPKGPWQEIVERHRQKIEAARGAEVEQRRAAEMQTRPPPAAQGESLAELTKRARRMQAALDTVLKRLNAIEQRVNAGTTTHPPPAETAPGDTPRPQVPNGSF